MKPYTKLMLLAAASLLIAAGCVSTDHTIAGGATDSPNSIAGMLVDPATSAPVADARVILTVASVSSDTVDKLDVSRGISPAVDSTRTDGAGRYEFAVAKRGTYGIYAQSRDSSLVLRVPEVVVDSVDIVLPPDTMRQPATVSGTVTSPAGYPCTITLLGTPYSTVADSSGRFSLSTLAAGRYAMATIIDNPGLDYRGAIAVDSITLAPGQSSVIASPLSVKLGGATGDNVNLGDFTTGNPFNLFAGIWWQSHNDSVVVSGTLIDSTGDATVPLAAHLSYRVSGQRPSAYLATNLGPDYAPWKLKGVRDFSQADSLTLLIKGSGGHMRLYFHSALVQNWNNLYYDIPVLPAQWTRVTIRLPADLRYLTDIYPQQPWSYLRQAVQSIWFCNDGGTPGDSVELWVGEMTVHF